MGGIMEKETCPICGRNDLHGKRGVAVHIGIAHKDAPPSQKKRQKLPAVHLLDTDQVKHYIKQRGFSMKEVAQRMGIAHYVLSAKVNRHQKWRFQEVANLCAALGVSPRFLWSNEIELDETFARDVELNLLEKTERVVQLRREINRARVANSRLGGKIGALESTRNGLIRQISQFKKDYQKERAGWTAERKELEQRLRSYDSSFKFVIFVLEMVLMDTLPDFSRTRLTMLCQYLRGGNLGETLWSLVSEDRRRVTAMQEV